MDTLANVTDLLIWELNLLFLGHNMNGEDYIFNLKLPLGLRHCQKYINLANSAWKKKPNYWSSPLTLPTESTVYVKEIRT